MGSDNCEHECIREAEWAVQNDHMQDMSRDLKLVLKMLRGNGEEGLVTKIALMKQSLDKLHERIDGNEKSIKAINNKAWGAMISVVLMGLFTIVRLVIGG